MPGLPTGVVSSATTSTTVPEQTTNYRSLLLTGADLSDAEDTFSERSAQDSPNGVPGASAFFVNDDDTRAISDTVLVYPDAAAATGALRQASASISTLVTGGTPKPVAIGTDGSIVAGTAPDENKSVTVLSFTHGPALVQLQFESATGDVTTEEFVTSVGKMQQIALRVGLTDPE